MDSRYKIQHIHLRNFIRLITHQIRKRYSAKMKMSEKIGILNENGEKDDLKIGKNRTVDTLQLTKFPLPIKSLSQARIYNGPLDS